MYRINSCPFCTSSALDVYPAGVAPFISDYVLNGTQSSSRLLSCVKCDFRFYETRYTDSEAQRLYDNYRGDRYFNARRRREPWYTRAFNESLKRHCGIDARRNEIAAWLEELRPGATNILDYGGDRGQYLPVRDGLQRFVFDISGVSPEPGVTAYSSSDQIGGKTFDAIVVAHVLEHVSDVGRVLDHIRKLCSPGAAVILEVPSEHFGLRLMGRGSAYQAWVEMALAVPGLRILADFYSAAFRVKFNTIPPFGFPRMHEHINYFNDRSLRAALQSRHFSDVQIAQMATTFGRTWVSFARA